MQNADGALVADLAARAEQLGLNAVTVHGRTRQQFYKDQADWVAIRAVVEAVAHINALAARGAVRAEGETASDADLQSMNFYVEGITAQIPQ